MDIYKIREQIVKEPQEERYLNINGKNIMLNKRIKNKTLRDFVEEF